MGSGDILILGAVVVGGFLLYTFLSQRYGLDKIDWSNLPTRANLEASGYKVPASFVDPVRRAGYAGIYGRRY